MMASNPRSQDDPSGAPARPWVLHIVPPNGGGVDRWVRDALARHALDAILHVSPEQWVLEWPAGVFLAIPPLGGTGHEAALGRPAWVHVHALTSAVMDAGRSLSKALRAELAVTLHDVNFTAGGAERAARIDVLRHARWVSVPSRYLLTVARAWMAGVGGDDWPPLHVVPNGWAPWSNALPAHPTGRGQYPIAMVGALGEHKGLEMARAVAALMPPELKMVLIGYADGALTPGWLVRDQLWVHGAFEPAALPALLSAYGARLVWFAAGQPESFCYALSDVWLAGWPVLVPDHGALGERVRQQGFGAVYDPALRPAEVVQRLVDWLRAPPHWPHADQPTLRETTVAAMLERLQALYETSMAFDSQPPDLQALQRMAQQHLDSRFFRQELLRLQGDLLAARAEADALRAELAQLAHVYAERGRWIEKLQADIDALNASVAELRARAEARVPWWDTVLRQLGARVRHWLG